MSFTFWLSGPKPVLLAYNRSPADVNDIILSFWIALFNPRSQSDPHFTGGETEAQRGEMFPPRSVAEPGTDPVLLKPSPVSYSLISPVCLVSRIWLFGFPPQWFLPFLEIKHLGEGKGNCARQQKYLSCALLCFWHLKENGAFCCLSLILLNLLWMCMWVKKWSCRIVFLVQSCFPCRCTRNKGLASLFYLIEISPMNSRGSSWIVHMIFSPFYEYSNTCIKVMVHLVHYGADSILPCTLCRYLQLCKVNIKSTT